MLVPWRAYLESFLEPECLLLVEDLSLDFRFFEIKVWLRG